MKTYIKPNTEVTKVIFEGNLLTGTGVKTGGNPGQEFTNTDVSYGKENEISSNSLWEEEE